MKSGARSPTSKFLVLLICAAVILNRIHLKRGKEKGDTGTRRPGGKGERERGKGERECLHFGIRGGSAPRKYADACGRKRKYRTTAKSKLCTNSCNGECRRLRMM